VSISCKRESELLSSITCCELQLVRFLIRTRLHVVIYIIIIIIYSSKDIVNPRTGHEDIDGLEGAR